LEVCFADEKIFNKTEAFLHTPLLCSLLPIRRDFWTTGVQWVNLRSTTLGKIHFFQIYHIQVEQLDAGILLRLSDIYKLS